MNIFDLRWLWRALRGRSVTFALVFFLAVVGFSTPRLIRGVLEPLPLPWLIVWIAPLIFLAFLAKLEPKLIPSEIHRRRLALGLVAAALIFFFVVPGLLPPDEPPPPTEPVEEQSPGTKRLKPPSRRGG